MGPAARFELASYDLKGRRSTVELRRHELREDGVEPPRDLNQTQMPYRLGYSRSVGSPARVELAASRLGNARSSVLSYGEMVRSTRLELVRRRRRLHLEQVGLPDSPTIAIWSATSDLNAHVREDGGF